MTTKVEYFYETYDESTSLLNSQNSTCQNYGEGKRDGRDLILTRLFARFFVNEKSVSLPGSRAKSILEKANFNLSNQSAGVIIYS